MALSLDDKAEWFELANTELDKLIATKHLFSADDLRDKLPEPGHPNWFGSVFLAASAKNRIKQMGFQLSRSKSRRGGVVRVWTPVINRTP